MKFEYTEVFNFKGALRGMRNPKESWDKSDSWFPGNSGTDCPCESCTCIDGMEIGKNDLALAQSLIRAGSEHRKFMRQIFVSVDITAPLYWWKEFDTYKVGTVANSTSTMHKLASTPITLNCFEMDDFEEVNIFRKNNYLQEEWETSKDFWGKLIPYLEQLRIRYNEVMENKKHLEEIKEFEEAKKAQVMAKKYWKELIRLLPESWLQRRTVTMNYENLLVMCSKGQRRNHKLTEWSKSFIEWARSLPYAKQLIFIDEMEDRENV
jgi:hypothetical protein